MVQVFKMPRYHVNVHKIVSYGTMTAFWSIFHSVFLLIIQLLPWSIITNMVRSYVLWQKCRQYICSLWHYKKCDLFGNIITMTFRQGYLFPILVNLLKVIFKHRIKKDRPSDGPDSPDLLSPSLSLSSTSGVRNVKLHPRGLKATRRMWISVLQKLNRTQGTYSPASSPGRLSGVCLITSCLWVQIWRHLNSQFLGKLINAMQKEIRRSTVPISIWTPWNARCSFYLKEITS